MVLLFLLLVENQCKECVWLALDWLHARLDQDSERRRHDQLSGELWRSGASQIFILLLESSCLETRNLSLCHEGFIANLTSYVDPGTIVWSWLDNKIFYHMSIKRCISHLVKLHLLQVASCTLDASAKIYAGRVDSIHAQAYKMLGGLGRADNQGKHSKRTWNVQVGDLDCLCTKSLMKLPCLFLPYY